MKEGWKDVLIGDVCFVQGGSTPRRTDESLWKDGTYPWFTVEDIRNQGRVITDTKQKVTKKAWDSLRVFPKDTILLCCTASVGEYAITKIDISSNQQFNGITIKDKTEISPMYLFYFCSTLKDKLLENSGKSTIDFVSGAKVRSLHLSYPPLPEQERIVKILDAAFEKIDRLKENAEKGLQEVKDLWEARLSNLFEAKDGWTNSNLGSLVDFKNGVNFTPSENGTKIKFLGVGDFKDRVTITASDLDYISTNQTIDNEYHLQKDDIIIVRSNGSKTLVGRTVIFNENIDEPLIYSGFCIRCRIKDKSLLLPAFLNILFRTTKVKRHLTYGDNGCNISNINQKKLSSLQISYPSLEDQNKIVEEYEILSSLCKRLTFNYEKELAEYEALKQSILRKAFSGEL